MQVYRVMGGEPGLCPHNFHATMTGPEGAHKLAKLRSDRTDVRIELVEVPTDKAAIIRLLSGWAVQPTAILRTWRLSPRGGLVEVENGE